MQRAATSKPPAANSRRPRRGTGCAAVPHPSTQLPPRKTARSDALTIEMSVPEARPPTAPESWLRVGSAPPLGIKASTTSHPTSQAGSEGDSTPDTARAQHTHTHTHSAEARPGKDSVFTALLLRRKYLLWRCALACERLRCEPWRPWGWGGTTRGLRIHSLVIEKKIPPMALCAGQVCCLRCVFAACVFATRCLSMRLLLLGVLAGLADRTSRGCTQRPHSHRGPRPRL